MAPESPDASGPQDPAASPDAALPDCSDLQVNLIGDGSMAVVLAMLLESKGARTVIWGAFPEHVDKARQTRETPYLPGHTLPEGTELTAEDSEAFAGADIVVSCVPTQYVRSVWERLAPHLKAAEEARAQAGATSGAALGATAGATSGAASGVKLPICSIAKGIENETLLRPTQIIGDVLQKAGVDHPDQPARPLAAMSGPSVAAELARCLPATVCVASDDDGLARLLQHVFTTSWFRVYTNADLLGVELAGALKNCIALAAGILDGLQAGNNAKSALLSRGLAEITRLGVAMGAKAETFFGLTGVGDLATTCFSPTGRNRTAGELLGKGEKLEAVLEQIPGIVEGVPTAKAVVGLAQKYRVEIPITEAVAKVLFEGLDPIEAIGQLMSRELKPERIG